MHIKNKIRRMKMNIKITSDSTCDLSAEILQEYDISIVPLYVEKGGEMFRDGVNIKPKDIFNHVSNGGSICSTAAANIADYTSFFEQYIDKYDAIIHINIGSGFSSCYQNACIAAQEFNNVYVVDSKNLSSGQGHVVVEAAIKVLEGISAEKIIEHLNNIIPKVRASFLLDRLDYMAKGGRCSSIVALGSNLLKIKPCIEVVDGKMVVGKKYRGPLKKCLLQYLEDKLSAPERIIPERAFITHTAFLDKETLDEIKNAVNQKVIFNDVYETDAGCTITCHCGQNTLGILFIEK